MRVALFGATGKIGRLVADQLSAAGHETVAYVRSPDKLHDTGPKTTVRQGQLSDLAAITEAIEGCDAVISALGPSLKRSATGTPITDGTRNIVTAMQAAGISRYIGLATPSVTDPRDQPTLKAKVLPVMARPLFPNALTELIGMTQAVTESGLDWTIARITNPTDKPAKNTLRAGFLGRDKVGSTMTRSDIAQFLVAQLTDTTYSHAAPAISN
jgi:uncharacterized protein YbjT (DUF2867 family)